MDVIPPDNVLLIRCPQALQFPLTRYDYTELRIHDPEHPNIHMILGVEHVVLLIDLLIRLKIKVLRMEAVAFTESTFSYITFDLNRCCRSLEEFWFIKSNECFPVFKEVMKLKHPFRKLVIDNGFYIHPTTAEYAYKHAKHKLIREQLETNYSIREIDLIDIEKTFSDINAFDRWKKNGRQYLSTMIVHRIETQKYLTRNRNGHKKCIDAIIQLLLIKRFPKDGNNPFGPLNKDVMLIIAKIVYSTVCTDIWF